MDFYVTEGLVFMHFGIAVQLGEVCEVQSVQTTYYWHGIKARGEGGCLLRFATY